MAQVQATQLGVVTFWSLCESNLDTLREGFKAIGLERYVPEAATPMSALRQALDACYPGHLIRKLKKPGFCVLDEEKGEEQNDYEPVAAAWFENDEIKLKVKPGADTDKFWAAYHDSKSILPSTQLGVVLSKIAIEEMRGTPLRPTGGVYWMDNLMLDSWRSIAAVIEASAKPPKGREPSAVYMIQHDINTESVRAIRDAIVNELQGNAGRLEAEVLKGDLKERALENRAQEAESLIKKAELYEQLLGVGLQGVRASLEQAKTAAVVAAMGSGGSSGLFEDNSQPEGKLKYVAA